MKTWFMIPVRGGSQGVPRKNIKLLGDKPLLAYTIETLLTISNKEMIIVISDDEEILDYARTFGVTVMQEPKTTGKATLDDVSLKVINSFEGKISDEDIFLTIQATCPFVSSKTILKGIELLKNDANSVITAIDDRHLSWGVSESGEPEPHYKERLNRQDLPSHFKESGAVIGSKVKLIKKNNTRINKPLKLIPISKEEGVDIDDFNDWAIAEYIVNKKKIFIRTDASKLIGMGHVYRSLAIAQELSKHQIEIFTLKENSLGFEFFTEFPFKVHQLSSESEFIDIVTDKNPEVTILDILDTKKEYITQLKQSSAKVITFEDMGEGANYADLLISDLYKNLSIGINNQLTGVQNSILAPSFETYNITPITISKDVEHILVLFGGTDPSGLTSLTLKSLKDLNYNGEVTVIQGLGQKSEILNIKDYGLKGQVLSNVKYMPKVMANVDMAISSAGRTIAELMTFGVPTVCLCQNEKELSHTHASQQFGVMNLGLGKLVTSDSLKNHLDFLMNNYDFRLKMHERAIHEISGRSNRDIMGRIFNFLEIAL
jgi:CMP-N-acetylneuraminic acid synthetase/spore coat polysaccharide biosynthesis predicted glycosyltransferase SpsG